MAHRQCKFNDFLSFDPFGYGFSRSLTLAVYCCVERWLRRLPNHVIYESKQITQDWII